MWMAPLNRVRSVQSVERGGILNFVLILWLELKICMPISSVPHPASCRWKPGLPTTKRTALLFFRPPTGFMPVDARFENFVDLLPVTLTQDRP